MLSCSISAHLPVTPPTNPVMFNSEERGRELSSPSIQHQPQIWLTSSWIFRVISVWDISGSSTHSPPVQLSKSPPTIHPNSPQILRRICNHAQQTPPMNFYNKGWASKRISASSYSLGQKVWLSVKLSPLNPLLVNSLCYLDPSTVEYVISSINVRLSFPSSLSSPPYLQRLPG